MLQIKHVYKAQIVYCAYLMLNYNKSFT